MTVVLDRVVVNRESARVHELLAAVRCHAHRYLVAALDGLDGGDDAGDEVNMILDRMVDEDAVPAA